MKKYKVGSIINNKWVIVSILYTRKQNKKILAFNLKTNSIKEGWIWDFTRDLVNNNPNRTMYCTGFTDINKLSNNLDTLLDEHFDLSTKCCFIYEWINRDELYYLQGIRENDNTYTKALFKKIDWLLYKAERNNKDKMIVYGAKDSKKLAKLIVLTYCILNKRGYFNKTLKEVTK